MHSQVNMGLSGNYAERPYCNFVYVSIIDGAGWTILLGLNHPERANTDRWCGEPLTGHRTPAVDDPCCVMGQPFPMGANLVFALSERHQRESSGLSARITKEKAARRVIRS
jgi:hypothetical protein